MTQWLPKILAILAMILFLGSSLAKVSLASSEDVPSLNDQSEKQLAHSLANAECQISQCCPLNLSGENQGLIALIHHRQAIRPFLLYLYSDVILPVPSRPPLG